MLTFADNFLAGSLLTLLLPILLVIALAAWYTLALRRVPEDTPETATKLPPPEVVAAAGPDVHELTPIDPDPSADPPPGGLGSPGGSGQALGGSSPTPRGSGAPGGGSGSASDQTPGGRT